MPAGTITGWGHRQFEIMCSLLKLMCEKEKENNGYSCTLLYSYKNLIEKHI